MRAALGVVKGMDAMGGLHKEITSRLEEGSTVSHRPHNSSPSGAKVEVLVSLIPVDGGAEAAWPHGDFIGFFPNIR